MKSETHPKNLEEFYVQRSDWIRNCLIRLGIRHSDLDDAEGNVLLRMLETNYIENYGKGIVDDALVAKFEYYAWMVIHDVAATYFQKEKMYMKAIPLETEGHEMPIPETKFQENVEANLHTNAIFQAFRAYVVANDVPNGLVTWEDGTVYERSLTQVLDLMHLDLSLTEIARRLKVTVGSVGNWKAKLKAMGKEFLQLNPDLDLKFLLRV